MRLALKLATGAGKTTVMAMLIAWQTINAVRRPGSKRFTRGFLIVTPGITIKDRLRVLQPNDPDNYYASRALVPNDMLDDLQRAKIVITNFHAFKLRERMQLSAGDRALLKGRTGAELQTLETEGQMIQRVMPDLMGLKRILVLNDEAHHCYREKPPSRTTPHEGRRAEGGREEQRGRTPVDHGSRDGEPQARACSRSSISRPRPSSCAGSGYAEGTLFPWMMSDFSLMDAIESGIVKLPRVPVAENIPGDEMPMFRNLWEHIRKDMPKKGRGKGGDLDPLKLPNRLQTALQALYGHYAKTFELWKEWRLGVPPCFIIVCQNTAISKLVYDYISGFYQKQDDGTSTAGERRLALFRNFDEYGNPLPRPNTLLIDSEQLEAGDALDNNFREDGRRRDRALPARDRRTHGGHPGRRQPHRPGAPAGGHEHRRQDGAARGGHPLRGLRLDAHRGVGREQRHAHPWDPRLRHAAPLRAGHRPGAPKAVVRAERGGISSTPSTRTSSASPSTSPRSP